MEELEKKFQELKLELAAYKRDRFWLAVVGGLILTFLGITSFLLIPSDIKKVRQLKLKSKCPMLLRKRLKVKYLMLLRQR